MLILSCIQFGYARITQLSEKIMLQDMANQEEEVGVDVAFPENLVRILPCAGNCVSELAHGHSLLNQHIMYSLPDMHASFLGYKKRRGRILFAHPVIRPWLPSLRISNVASPLQG